MIKYLIMDIDGTLTDGKIYMGNSGECIKAFSVKDGYVIKHILKPKDIIPIILTARTSDIVQNRCVELGIKEVYQGKVDKLKALKEIIGEQDFCKCAYFGDDILDLNSMLPIKDAGGVVGCPADAVQEVKAAADYICNSRAGEGALREFVEWLVKPKVDNDEIALRVKKAIDYIKGLNIKEKDIGKHVVDNQFFYVVQEYITKYEEECDLESHRKYIDVQILIEGEEAMDISDISRLVIKEKYNIEKDVMYWNIPNRMARIKLKAGDYVILYPENAHRGAIAIEKCDKVLKIVGKVSVD